MTSSPKSPLSLRFRFRLDAGRGDGHTSAGMSMIWPQQQSPAVRAADTDRENTVQILQKEAGLGRLSPDELSARLDKCFKAQTMGELQALIADLPEGNINPWNEMMTGAVQTGMKAARMGIAITVFAVIAGIFAPVIAGLAATGHGTQALIATGVLVVVCLAAGHRFSRGRRSK